MRIIITILFVIIANYTNSQILPGIMALGRPQSGPDTVAIFNLMSTSAAAVAGYETVAGTPHSGIVTASDSRSGSAIGISSVATGFTYWGQPSNSASNTGGQGTNDGGGFAFPVAVIASRWYVSSGNRDTTLSNLRFSGLDISKKYTFIFFGSRSSASVANPSQTVCYRIVTDIDDKRATLDAKGNTSKLAIITGVTPKSDGTVNGYVNWVDDTLANINVIEIIRE